MDNLLNSSSMYSSFDIDNSILTKKDIEEISDKISKKMSDGIVNQLKEYIVTPLLQKGKMR